MSPIRASLCSLRLSVRISKLSKIVTARARGFETRNSSCSRRFACSNSIGQRSWHLVKFYAGGSHLFYQATYQIVALKLDFPFAKKCAYYLMCSLLAITWPGKSDQSVLLLFTHLSRCTRYRADIFTSSVFFYVLDLVRYTFE